jgi:hypothetical protein
MNQYDTLKQMVGFLKENGETEGRASLNRLDISRPNKVMILFALFIKYVEKNFVFYFGRFPMLQKCVANSGSLYANKHAHILMHAASDRFSRITDLHIISFC